MAETKRKGDLGESMVIAEVMRRGYKVALPVGEDWPFDFIVLRQGKLERVQCKYTESDGKIIEAKCRSTNNWVDHKYTQDELDWIAVYDKTTNKCYFLPSSMLEEGKTQLTLRVTAPQNGQKKGIRLASDFEAF